LSGRSGSVDTGLLGNWLSAWLEIKRSGHRNWLRASADRLRKWCKETAYVMLGRELCEELAMAGFG